MLGFFEKRTNCSKLETNWNNFGGKRGSGPKVPMVEESIEKKGRNWKEKRVFVDERIKKETVKDFKKEEI